MEGISALKPLTYSELLNNIDSLKAKNEKSQYNYLDLKKLVENFQLDARFISKSYYQSSPEYAFNDPPKGPIPEYFECIHCEQRGPDSHLNICTKPFESSLYLTEEGTFKYKRPSGTSYKLLVKKRGQKKIVSTSIKNQRFSDNVELIYENDNQTTTIIKIGKNGVVNIISANFDNGEKMKKDLFKKINQTNALNTSEYPGTTFVLNKAISYVYLMLVQFNLYPRQETNYINLAAVDLNLWGTPLFKQGRGSQIFFVIAGERYPVQNYRYNSGDIVSRSNHQTNPFIQFDLISDSIFKVGILIYKRGAVQMRLSYLDKNFGEKEKYPLRLETLKQVYVFLKKLFEILILSASETNYPIIVSEVAPERKGILNMVDGGQPKVCQDRKGRELRPVPYSFYGTCPLKGYYVRPEGKKRPDGLYEPCCYKIKQSGKDSKKYIEDLYRNGYKDVIDPDKLSAVFIPGTKTVESRRFNGLDDLTQEQLLDFMELHGYIGKKNPFTQKITPVLQFERFSYIPVLQNKKGVLMTSIPEGSLRVFLQIDQTGKAVFINTNYEMSDLSVKNVTQLHNSVLDGYLETESEIFYPFDIILFQNKDITQEPFKKRFDILMYSLDILTNTSLNIVANFDESFENIQEPDSFIIFIPLTSVYTPGQINKTVKIYTKKIDSLSITLNVSPYRSNRWRVSYQGREIPEMLLPQREKVKVTQTSIEIPVVFSNKNKLKENDIVLFQINTNVNGLINSVKPLIPVQKMSHHINDYSDIINILEHIQTFNVI
jgi:hypothetical protein